MADRRRRAFSIPGIGDAEFAELAALGEVELLSISGGSLSDGPDASGRDEKTQNAVVLELSQAARQRPGSVALEHLFARSRWCLPADGDDRPDRLAPGRPRWSWGSQAAGRCAAGRPEASPDALDPWPRNALGPGPQADNPAGPRPLGRCDRSGRRPDGRLAPSLGIPLGNAGLQALADRPIYRSSAIWSKWTIAVWSWPVASPDLRQLRLEGQGKLTDAGLAPLGK